MIKKDSFTTHLLGQGVDLRDIQKVLGNDSSTTTEIYTHVSKKSIAIIKDLAADFLIRKIKMIKEKYIPSLLSHQIGGITTIGDTHTLVARL